MKSSVEYQEPFTKLRSEWMVQQTCSTVFMNSLAHCTEPRPQPARLVACVISCSRSWQGSWNRVSCLYVKIVWTCKLTVIYQTCGMYVWPHSLENNQSIPVLILQSLVGVKRVETWLFAGWQVPQHQMSSWNSCPASVHNVNLPPISVLRKNYNVLPRVSYKPATTWSMMM